MYDTAAVPATRPFTVQLVPTGTKDTAEPDDAHIPAGVLLVSTTDDPEQTESIPETAAGKPFTVTVAVAKQPATDVYETRAVPAETPDTSPTAETVATVVPAVDQMPPANVLLSIVVAPTHTENVPAMGAGVSLTVTTTVLEHPKADV
jgi:hypothetical protein